MTISPARSRKPAEDRRRDIADAALRVIADDGLGRFTALAIARQVGVSDAALFRHFPNKEAIVLAAIERVEELLLDTFPPPGGDPLLRLGTFFRRRVSVIRSRPGIARLFASEELSRAAPPEGVARLATLRQRSMSFVGACVAEAAASGILARGVAAEEAALVVLGALLALAHSGAVPPGDSGDLPERVWRTLERFLRGPARPRHVARRPPRSEGRRTRSPKQR
ncbi:TetR/AcrR family transcriptional regulator [Anaeromyxobacter sp. Fw109-5]|uniref:TetR/AcrR family transcriptional regulator n=1 Tax=Anaeromyxobacter sp. (strain Fw109-5) TaxID=404589 RepID=UPI0000ED71AB|nr:TetR/AcrR family transcriptional regulator [Anaeromyxobacter sp. Fw109-5]ABS27724.1 transcriptional regulator, TetR family [Anaeromyxobacter sp. Fw109-5]